MRRSQRRNNPFRRPHGAKRSVGTLFIDHQLAELERDRAYYLGKAADAADTADRERYLTALVDRLKHSADLGLLYKEDAERAIENIPGDLDALIFNRDFELDPGTFFPRLSRAHQIAPLSNESENRSV